MLHSFEESGGNTPKQMGVHLKLQLLPTAEELEDNVNSSSVRLVSVVPSLSLFARVPGAVRLVLASSALFPRHPFPSPLMPHVSFPPSLPPSSSTTLTPPSVSLFATAAPSATAPSPPRTPAQTTPPLHSLECRRRHLRSPSTTPGSTLSLFALNGGEGLVFAVGVAVVGGLI
ncbi:hypothetical protein DFH08DRAFT_964986 [Mycena albidolilacea]|uniref:Uncharacterized protein n=1 Tax=Mycena albidolilacea TaxID=1033008 RepID=A0AAD7EKU7_9AGAR|nr:hypothetical protein DFH08DRAFT_964986 [Mycena albidolilacea]